MLKSGVEGFSRVLGEDSFEGEIVVFEEIFGGFKRQNEELENDFWVKWWFRVLKKVSSRH